MIKNITDLIFSITEKYVVLRYIISGGMSAATDLVVLYVLNTSFGMHYLAASVLAFGVSFFVSFVMQKFWTFKSHDEKTHKQAVMYLGSSLSGLGLNTLLMYVFVGYFHVLVIISQIIVGILVALCTFFISRNLVFKYKKI